MGDMADLYDYWDDNPNEEDEIIELLSKGVWRTAGGDEIRIEDMEASHLKNSIAWLKRNFTKDFFMYDYVALMKSEMTRRLDT